MWVSVRVRAGDAHTPRGLGKVPGGREAILQAKGISPPRHVSWSGSTNLVHSSSPSCRRGCREHPQPCSEIPSGLVPSQQWWSSGCAGGQWASPHLFPPSDDEQDHFQPSQWLSRGVCLCFYLSCGSFSDCLQNYTLAFISLPIPNAPAPPISCLRRWHLFVHLPSFLCLVYLDHKLFDKGTMT